MISKIKNYKNEITNRVEFIRGILASAHADGIVYGNSGGKDSALVGILCKMACENTVGLIMPCGSKRNYDMDKSDAEAIAERYGIATKIIDLTGVKTKFHARLAMLPGLTILRRTILRRGCE